MGTQNGSKPGIWPWGILIHTLELKIRHFEVSPYVCIGKPCICNVFRPCATWGVGLCAHVYMTTFARFVQKWNMGIEPACTVRLYNAVCLYYVDFPDNFFFCLVCWLAWKKQIKIYTFLNFQCHFHCQVISKNVLVKTKATTMLLSRWSSSLSVTSSDVKCAHWFKSCLGQFFPTFFTASDTLSTYILTGSKQGKASYVMSVATINVINVGKRYQNDQFTAYHNSINKISLQIDT